ncbi:MAG: Mut7-C RNAse domain-containing protein [Gammaproteobacteria bacterium]
MEARFRFYAALNDFLPLEKRQVLFSYIFKDNPAIKDSIEAIGVPHTAIDIILVNGRFVDFSYLLQDGDVVSVYPMFTQPNIENAIHLQQKLPDKLKFIVDVHLGTLAKYLRMLGFDVIYRNTYIAREILTIAVAEKRIILTRSIALLKNKSVNWGYWVRSKYLIKQLIEIMHQFDLLPKIKPFSRCMLCNGEIKEVAKTSVINKLPKNTNKYFEKFYQCSSCGKIYWQGSHYNNMRAFIRKIINQ